MVFDKQSPVKTNFGVTEVNIKANYLQKSYLNVKMTIPSIQAFFLRSLN